MTNKCKLTVATESSCWFISKKFVSFLIFLFLATFVSAQTTDIENPMRIVSINIEYMGPKRSQEKAILRFLQISEGQEFSNPNRLKETVERERQRLANTRYYKQVIATALPVKENSNEYAVLISLEEDSTFIIIPYPLPNSSVGKGGWSFGLQVQYDNAFGSLSDLRLGGNVKLAFDEEQILKGWQIYPEWKNIKLGNNVLGIRYRQAFLTTEVTDPSRPRQLNLLQHYSNHQSFVELDFEIPLNDRLSYRIIPELGLKYAYDYHKNFEGLKSQDNKSVIEDRGNLIFAHSLEFGQIDWENKLRSGYLIVVKNALNFFSSWQPSSGKENFRFTSDLQLNGAIYHPIGKHVYYYGKLAVQGTLLGEQTELGKYLRGVKNSSMHGNFAVFLQNSFGTDLFKLGNVQMQLHPFVDMGFALRPTPAKSFSDVFRIGFGGELVGIIGSITLKGKLGYDPVSDYLDFDFSMGLSY